MGATLIPIQRPSDSDLGCKWFPGKHRMHGGKVQVVASSDGRLMHVSQLIPEEDMIRTCSEFLGSPNSLRQQQNMGRETRHPYILGDSGYTGLQDVYPELIAGKRRIGLE